MEIHLIWAQDINGGIGKDGKLPWHLSEDLKNFKKITSHHPVIMGRKTWDSLPIKPLPNRRNIILSNSIFEDLEVYNNVQLCIKELKQSNIKKVFVIGGSSIYEQFFEYATHLHVTIININTENIDTFFPKDINQIKNFFSINSRMDLSQKAEYTYWIKNEN